MYKKLFFTICLISLSLISCDDELNINQSPNNPAASTPALTLPAGQLFQGHAIGLDLALMSGFIAQYWTQSPEAGQYEVYDRYNYTGTSTIPGWRNSWYGALSDYRFVKDQGVLDGLSNHSAVATLLMAYQYQVLVDIFGDIPFDEALQGGEGNLQPAYESGEVVYGKIINLINEGLDLIVDGGIVPGNEDLMLQGDMDMWRKFGNTLLLRVYMRQSEVLPGVAEAGIRDLETRGLAFLSEGENVFISYPGTTGNENPLYSGDVRSAGTGLGDNNISGSASVIQRMLDAGDPRVDFYYDPAVDTEGQLGIVQGDGVEEELGETREGFSTPSDNNVTGATAPVYLMTGHESLFLQAEAIERGWMTGDAKTAYNSAVSAAFTFAGGLDASTFIADGGFYAYDGLVSIHTQKWLSMAGTQVVEGWAEWRRTDTPALEQSSEGTAASLGSSRFPRRAFYPTVELNNNPNTPANTNIGEPIWWDVSE